MDGRSRVLVAAGMIAAVAVGLLLGSSPLRSWATGGNTSEAERLREQLDEAREDADAARAEALLGVEFADANAPMALAGTLEGRAVALVRTADAMDQDAADITLRMADAGATVGADVTVTADWTSDERAPFRDALAEQITASLAEPPQGASTEQILAAALAQSLAPGVAAGTDLAGQQATERADTLWTLLTESGLVAGTRTAPVDLFVLMTGAGDEPLAQGLSANGNGTVVAFTGNEAGPVGEASSVTNATTFYGAIAVTAALAQEVSGASGNYDASDAPELVSQPSS